MAEGVGARGKAAPPSPPPADPETPPEPASDGASRDGSSSSKEPPGSPMKDLGDAPAPPGLICAYRKQRHWAMTLGRDLVLPVLVVSLGCFFSVRGALVGAAPARGV